MQAMDCCIAHNCNADAVMCVMTQIAIVAQTHNTQVFMPVTPCPCKVYQMQGQATAASGSMSNTKREDPSTQPLCKNAQ